MSTMMLTGLAAALALAATIVLVVVDHGKPGRGRRPPLRGVQLLRIAGPVEPPRTIGSRLRAVVGATAMATLLGLVLAVTLIVCAVIALVVVNQGLG